MKYAGRQGTADRSEFGAACVVMAVPPPAAAALRYLPPLPRGGLAQLETVGRGMHGGRRAPSAGPAQLDLEPLPLHMGSLIWAASGAAGGPADDLERRVQQAQQAATLALALARVAGRERSAKRAAEGAEEAILEYHGGED